MILTTSAAQLYLLGEAGQAGASESRFAARDGIPGHILDLESCYRYELIVVKLTAGVSEVGQVFAFCSPQDQQFDHFVQCYFVERAAVQSGNEHLFLSDLQAVTHEINTWRKLHDAMQSV